MRDAIVSFITLILVCTACWAVIVVLETLVTSAGALVTPSQAWFCFGFALALVKPWRHILPCTRWLWEAVDEWTPR